jgi:hydrogenase maturation protease
MNDNLVIGVGNPILADDAVGPLAVENLQKLFKKRSKNIDFKINYSGGFDLLLEMIGYRRVLVIDSIQYRDDKPGSFIFLTLNDLRELKFGSFLNTHGLDFASLWDLGKKLNLEMPSECLLCGIAAKDCEKFSENLSQEVQARFPEIISNLKVRIARWSEITN